MEEPMITVSGLRGIVAESITPPIAMKYACAFAAGLAPGPLLISRDSRTTGEMFSMAICSAMCAMGRDVIDAGMMATPTTGVLVRQHRCAGGIQISASHNPAEYNGMKLFSAAGQVISASEGEKVLNNYHQGTFHWVGYDELGQLKKCDDAHSHHCTLVLETVEVERIRQRKFHVLLDANHGAGSLLGRRLLEELGCQITLLGEKPDGQFAHVAEPTAENLAGVCQEVTKAGADVGFCQDPDADRLAVIDENGRYVGEEYTLAMCLDHVLRQKSGPVVTNMATSRMSEDLAGKYGASFFHSAVGEANVVGEMQKQKAVFGGEGNGGPIDPRVGYVRDSFVGMANLLDAMAARKKTISALADELPRYEILKSKMTFPREKIQQAFEALEKHFHDAKADRSDGLRLDWPGSWVLLRASNTEPIVRIIVEAKSKEEAQRLSDEAAKVVKSC